MSLSDWHDTDEHERMIIWVAALDRFSNCIYLQRSKFDKLNYISPTCDHDFVQTGMHKTWCKKCDCDGVFENGKVEIK